MPPNEDPHFLLFKREVETIREVVDVKFDAVRQSISQMGNVLNRMVDQMEKQNENHLRIALNEQRLGTLEDFTNAQDVRLTKVEGSSQKTTWGFDTAKIAFFACAGFIADIIARYTLHKMGVAA